jgi:hypothetical protein
MEKRKEQISTMRTTEDYKKVIEEQRKALKTYNKLIREKDKIIIQKEKEISNLRWRIRQKQEYLDIKSEQKGESSNE